MSPSVSRSATATAAGWLATTGLLPDPEHRRREADKGIGGGRPTRCGTVVTDVLFMASRDGNAFHVWPEAVVRPGIQRPGSWYYGGAWFTWGMLRTPSVFPGAPDELDRIVSWQGRRDLDTLRGQPLRMMIELKDADIYSFVFTSADGAGKRKNQE